MPFSIISFSSYKIFQVSNAWSSTINFLILLLLLFFGHKYISWFLFFFFVKYNFEFQRTTFFFRNNQLLSIYCQFHDVFFRKMKLFFLLLFTIRLILYMLHFIIYISLNCRKKFYLWGRWRKPLKD